MNKDVDRWRGISGAEIRSSVIDYTNCKFVQQTMRKLATDSRWSRHIIRLVERRQIETRCIMSWLARTLQPDTYLEIGVRRGFSMAMVAGRYHEVEIYGFDNWMTPYASIDNPGPSFVERELLKVGYQKPVHWFNGDSHDLLPELIRAEDRPKSFDLILVDGDHTAIGAYQDCTDVFPLCSIGGIVVFDDIAPDRSSSAHYPALATGGMEREYDLMYVWQSLERRFTNFRFFTYDKNSPGVGMAVRLA